MPPPLIWDQNRRQSGRVSGCRKHNLSAGKVRAEPRLAAQAFQASWKTCAHLDLQRDQLTSQEPDRRASARVLARGRRTFDQESTRTLVMEVPDLQLDRVPGAPGLSSTRTDPDVSQTKGCERREEEAAGHPGQ